MVRASLTPRSLSLRSRRYAASRFAQDATQPLASLKTLRSAVKGARAHAELLHGCLRPALRGGAHSRQTDGRT